MVEKRKPSIFTQRQPLLLQLGSSVFFGLIWFLLLFGPQTLNPTYVDWIYVSGTDLFQHQNGWEWFRQEAWRLPLGSIQAFGYPFGTTVSFTDSIPLFAFVFRLFSFLLPPDFQYLGLWILVSLMGQFFFGMLIVGEFTKSYIKMILGASLLVLSPVLINRVFFHNSLTAQWILLAGIWFILVEYRRKLWRGAWLLLFSISLLIHLYFVVMLLPLWAISLWLRFSRDKQPKAIIVDILAVTVVGLFISFLIGLFSLSLGDLLGEGYGFYSWNLNGFINPGEYSAVLPGLPLGTEGQTEGFSYLGLGNLILLPLGLFFFLKEGRLTKAWKLMVPVLLVCLLFLLFALSNRAFANQHSLWDFQLPKKIEISFALFRASGRFIWPVYYMIVLFSLLNLVEKKNWVIPILLGALLLQFFDLQPLISSKHIPASLRYQSPLQSEFWNEAAQVNQHVVLLPAAKAHSIYQPFSLYARKNHLTLNWGYFSRANLGAIKDHGDQLWNDILIGQADEETLFILWDPDWELVVGGAAADQLVLCEVDGFLVGLAPQNAIFTSATQLEERCMFP